MESVGLNATGIVVILLFEQKRSEGTIVASVQMVASPRRWPAKSLKGSQYGTFHIIIGG
jgi:hypothetical protein